MPLPATLLLFAALLPLMSYALLLLFGRRFGSVLAAGLATTFAAGGFAMSLAGMIAWFNGGQFAGVSWGPGDLPINVAMKWLPIGPAIAAGAASQASGYLNLDIYVDSLTILMCNTVTLVFLMVTCFSIVYMAPRERLHRFFSYLALAEFAMIVLVLAGNILQSFMGWELMGICFFLLHSFWNTRPRARRAAVRMFVLGRVCDVGLLVGMGILFAHLGNVSFPELNRLLSTGAGSAGRWIVLPGGMNISSGTLTLAGIGLFIGAAGKSALFPFHVALTDLVEGPIPVSAVAQSVGAVAAGVYLMGRLFPILTPDAKLFIAIIGMFTLAMGALVAIAQRDLRKVLAYSTVSQLGLIFLALGIGSWPGAFFQLVTHAFFKSLLLLCAGSVMRAAQGEHSLPQLGGLFRKLPVTAAAFALGTLAISGVPFLSGAFSEQMILNHAGAFAAYAVRTGHSAGYWALFIVPVVAAYLMPFAIARCWMLIFWGKPRNAAIAEKARETGALWVGPVVLACFAILGGSQLLNIRSFISLSMAETTHYGSAAPSHSGDSTSPFAQSWPADSSADESRPVVVTTPLDTGQQLSQRYAGWAFLIGIGAAFVIYSRGHSISNLLVRLAPLRAIHTWLFRGMYFEELYASVFAPIAALKSDLCAAFDRGVMDLPARYVVDRAGRLVAVRIRLYVVFLAGLVIVAAATALIMDLTR